MPSVPAGDQGGFVPATDVMTEMIRVGARLLVQQLTLMMLLAYCI